MKWKSFNLKAKKKINIRNSKIKIQMGNKKIKSEFEKKRENI